ncbi:MAG: acetoin utilization protein AcuC, partial [Promethearchaeota archaeon]
MSKTALVMSDEFKAYNFGKFHPLKPERVLLTWDLIKALELDKKENTVILEPKLATDEEIEIFHSIEYVEFIKEITALMEKGPVPDEYIIKGIKYNLGPGDNPMFKKMHQGSAIVIGGTLVAMRAVTDDNGIDKAFNAAGGLHHALYNAASGFCIYNDPVIGILDMFKKFPEKDLKVMYIDVDAHHGDGVQKAFYSNPSVLTVSFHESGKTLFPGTGFMNEIGEGDGEGFSVNIPLPPFTVDNTYLDIFDEIIPKLANVFKPDIIVSQNGVDTHCADPLTHLGLTTRGHIEIFKRINQLSNKFTKGKLVALGGGGYNISVVPRSWTMLYADLIGV